MIISTEQARLAAQEVSNSRTDGTVLHVPVSDELMSRVHDVLDKLPETRLDRIRDAEARLMAGTPDAHEVASQLISRCIADMVR